MSFLLNVFSFLNSIPILIWGIIIIVGCFSIWAFWEITKNYLQLQKNLMNISNSLKKYKSQITIDELSEIEDLFTQAKFNNKYYLEHIWVEFDETLEKARNQKVYNTLQSEDFFNLKSIIPPNINHLELIKAVPGLLTAIGLFGTFCAILIGLLHVHVLPGGQVSGIEGLINGLAGKFASSIVALACSIVITIYEKIKYSKLIRVCLDIQRTMNRIFPRRSTEKLLIEVLKNSEEQSAALKSFSTDMSGHLKAGVKEGIAPLVENLTATLTEIKKEKQESSSEAIGAMISDFKSSLTGAAGKEMQNMASVMSNITQTLSNFDSNNKEFENRVNFMIEALDKTIKNQQEQFEYHVNSVNDIISSQALNVNTLLSQLDEKMERYKVLVDESANVQGVLRGLAKDISTAGEQIVKSANVYENVNQSIIQLTQLSKQDEERYRNSIEQYEKQVQIIKNVENSISTILNNVHNSLVSYSQQTNNSLKDYLMQYDEQMSNVTNHLSVNIQELDDKLEDLNDILAKHVNTEVIANG